METELDGDRAAGRPLLTRLLWLAFTAAACFLGSSCSLDEALQAREKAWDIEPDEGPAARAAYESLFDPASCGTILLRMSRSEWLGLGQDLVDYYNEHGNAKTGALRKADFSYTGADGVTERIEGVSIRVRGNLTRDVPQWDGEPINPVHFLVKFDDTEGMDPWSLEYRERAARRFRTLSSLNLKISYFEYNDDATRVREQFAYAAYRAAGVKAPRTGNADLRLSIDGAPPLNLGPYSVIEPVNSGFVKKRFPDPERGGALYKCLWTDEGPADLVWSADASRRIGAEDWKSAVFPTYSLSSGASDGSDILELMLNLKEMDGDSLKTWLDAHFDVEGFLRLTAVSVLIGHPDDYWSNCNNYYLYFDPLGPTEEIPYDCDNCLGGGWVPFDTSAASVYTYHDMAGENMGRAMARPLVERILRIPSYLARYEALVKELADPSTGVIAAGSYRAWFDRAAALLGPYVATDTNQGTVAMDGAQADAVEAWMAARRASALAQLAEGAPWAKGQ